MDSTQVNVWTILLSVFASNGLLALLMRLYMGNQKTKAAAAMKREEQAIADRKAREDALDRERRDAQTQLVQYMQAQLAAAQAAVSSQQAATTATVAAMEKITKTLDAVSADLAKTAETQARALEMQQEAIRDLKDVKADMHAVAVGLPAACKFKNPPRKKPAPAAAAR